MRYRVKHVYAATKDGTHYGPWTPGEVVELDAELAEWVNRDSPGVLVPAVDDQEQLAKREMPSTPDRQQKRAPKSR